MLCIPNIQRPWLQRGLSSWEIILYFHCWGSSPIDVGTIAHLQLERFHGIFFILCTFCDVPRGWLYKSVECGRETLKQNFSKQILKEVWPCSMCPNFWTTFFHSKNSDPKRKNCHLERDFWLKRKIVIFRGNYPAGIQLSYFNSVRVLSVPFCYETVDLFYYFCYIYIYIFCILLLLRCEGVVFLSFFKITQLMRRSAPSWGGQGNLLQPSSLDEPSSPWWEMSL